MSLMPCFQPNQAFEEGVIIGRILAGYGELELTMTDCLIAIEGQLDTPLRCVFGAQGAERRIKKAKKALKEEYIKAGLAAELNEALDDMDWCRQICNQYAHCSWYWTHQEGLCFVNLEDLAKQPKTILKLMDGKRSVNTQLLSVQEDFLNYVKEFLSYLADAYRAWNRMRSAPKQRAHVFPKPSKITRPSLYN